MSHLEEIEKLKADIHGWKETVPGGFVMSYALMDDLIDRAVSLGGKFVRDRVEFVGKTRMAEGYDMKEDIYALTKAASQALSELESKAIQLGVVEKE